MSNTWRKYGVPILVMIVGGILVKVESEIFSSNFANTLIIITKALVMFAFGISLSLSKRKRNESWLKKIIISFFLLFFIFWDLGYIVVPALKSFFNLIGISGFVIHLFYVYLGYAFFD